MRRNRFKKYVSRMLNKIVDDYRCLNSAVIELNNVFELKNALGWKNDPIKELVLDDPSLKDFDYILDVNERRIRDAESIATIMQYSNPAVALEIGTAFGKTTALMAKNAVGAKIYTVNILSEEILSGEGGVLTTTAFHKNDIGRYYRELQIQNVTQIYANTATWDPNIGTIDVAYIDGCHDSDFVFNDTRKVLKHMKPGSIIIWHDFNLDLVKKYNWIDSVCTGVENLLLEGLLKGPILHVRDSWCGVCKIGN